MTAPGARQDQGTVGADPEDVVHRRDRRPADHGDPGHPDRGLLLDTKHGNAVAGVKMLIGAAIGKTLDDSIEGKLTV